MIELHDTAAGKRLPFEPINRHGVRMYVCGPTVYDVPHIGNARPAVIFDTLFRLLRHTYGDDAVIYARNYTDIDDKIIARAAEEGISIEALTERTIAEYEALTSALNVLEPTIKPRATDSLVAINKMIERLFKLCAAYISDGHILFDVSSGVNLSALVDENVERLAGHRVAVADYKDDPRDFVLWKPSKEGEPVYDGPFGMPGRPGWHIECSAMIREHLGNTIDIHGGGNDLIFPHHSCEILQSETANGDPLARHWLHNGMLTVDGQKMSKSAGNFITVPDALERAPGEAVRYLLLSGHYRQPLDFTWEKLAEAKVALDRIYRALELVWDSVEEPPEEGAARTTALWKTTKEYPTGEARWPTGNEVEEALGDDLNTPKALAALHNLASYAFQEKPLFHPYALKHRLWRAGAMLGLLQQSPHEWFRGDVDTNAVLRLIGMREMSRQSRDFAQADAIRAELRDMGVTVEDTPQGPVWHTI